MVNVLSAGGGAAIGLQNLKDVDINLPFLPVPGLGLENNGDLSNPAIFFTSNPTSGMALRGTSNRFAIIVDGDECIAAGTISGGAAVNCLLMVPSVANFGPLVTSLGADDDIDLSWLPRGNGAVNVLGKMLVTNELGPQSEPLVITVVDVDSALLELRSVTKGFLQPRMTTAQRLAIPSPAEGLQVYDFDEKRNFLFDTAWRATSGVFTVTKTIDSGSAGFPGTADAKRIIIADKSLVISFIPTQKRSVFFTETLSASYVEGSDIDVIIGWAPDDTSAGNVVWEVELTMITPDSGDTLDGPSTILSVVAPAPEAVFKVVRAPTITFDGTGITSADVVNIRVSRLGNDGADTYGDDALMSGIAIKFQLSG